MGAMPSTQISVCADLLRSSIDVSDEYFPEIPETLRRAIRQLDSGSNDHDQKELKKAQSMIKITLNRMIRISSRRA
jgi:hypothetical protein